MTTIQCQVTDLSPLQLGATQRARTPEGFLVAPGSIGRVGVQSYLARELGLDTSAGMDGDRRVRLHRPHEEVFDPETMQSFEGKTLTVTHPPKDVTADTWRDVACGDCRDVHANGRTLDATLTIRDADAIRTVLDGTNQLSCGYAFNLDLTPGTTADGEEYDGIQRKIRGNHVAIVDMARGGAGCRIADSNPERRTHMIKKVIDGISLEFADETQASVVEKLVGDATARAKLAGEEVAKATKRATDAETERDALKADNAKLATDHVAKVKELEGKILKPDAIDALVEQRTKVIGDGAKLMPDLAPASKSVEQIRAEVLTHVVASDGPLTDIAKAALAGSEPSKADPIRVAVAFDAVVASAAKLTNDDEPRREPSNATAVRDAVAGRRTTTASPKVGRDKWIEEKQKRSNGTA